MKPEARCNCENKRCKDHEAGSCKRAAGQTKVYYVGSVCDHCARAYSPEYIKIKKGE